jgi:WD40 repeat protein
MQRLFTTITLLALLLGEEICAQTIKRESSIALPPGIQVVLASMASSGDRVAAVGGDGAVRVWKLPSGDLAKTLEMGQTATALQFSSDSRLIAIGDETGTVKVWDVSSWKVVLEFSAASDAWINALAISRDDGLLAVANDYDVQVWNLSTHQRVATVRAPFGHSFALSFSPDSRWLASADQDAVVRLYDPQTGGLRSSVTDLLLESFSLDFSPDGKSLLVGGADRTISVIDPASGKIVRALPKESGLPKTLLVSTDGKQAAVIYPLPERFNHPSVVLLWDLGTQTVRARFERPGVFVIGGAFTGDRFSLVGSSGGDLSIWSMK